MAQNLFRRAHQDDAVFIADLIGEFYGKVGAVYQGIPFDRRTAVLGALRVIREGICLVGPTSCAGALIRPFDWNKEYQVAQVAFWYFRRAKEMVIFDEICRLCREAGASHVVANSHFPKNTVGRWYAGRGMGPAEESWCGKLVEGG